MKKGYQHSRISQETRDFADLTLPVLATVYMLFTMALFLLGPYPALLSNMNLLISFLVMVLVVFWLGFGARIAKPDYITERVTAQKMSPWLKSVFVLSCVWYITFSIASMAEYGAGSVSEVIGGILDPGASYFAKFDVYLEQQLSGRTNPVLQASVLTSVLSTVLVPFLVYYWKMLPRIYRGLGLLSVGIYMAYFLFIGTQKGIGDVVVVSAVALLARYASDHEARDRLGSRYRKFFSVGLVGALAFGAYVAVNQADRISGTSVEAQFAPNPIVASIFGESFARGVSVAAFYPSHGYYGLALNLDTPFVWAGGLGGAPALASYKVQYFGGEDPIAMSFPARTEALTGWPAGQYWSTVFPWIASDFSFPGVFLVVFCFGIALAHCWTRIRYRADPLALVMLTQLAIIVAYVPANNQILVTRTAAVGFICLIVAYVVRLMLRGLSPGQHGGVASLQARSLPALRVWK